MVEHGPSLERAMVSTVQPTSPRRDRSFAVSKRSRGRSGCLNCRRRRKKCDEGKPECAKCTARGESCEWDNKVTFRLSGIDTFHPSMVSSRNLKGQGGYQIMNFTFDKSTSTSHNFYHEQQDAISQHSSSSSHEPNMRNMQEGHSNRNRTSSESEQTLGSLSKKVGAFSQSAATTGSSSDNHSNTQAIETSTRFHVSDNGSVGSVAFSLQSNTNRNHNDRESSTNSFPISLPRISTPRSMIEMAGLPSETAITSGYMGRDPLHSEPGAQTQPTASSSKLEALDYLTSQSINFESFGTTAQSGGSLKCYPERESNVIYSPFTSKSAVADPSNLQTVWCSNATYEDLHTTLYHHMVDTARNTALSRQTSLDPFAQEGSPIVHDALPSSSNTDEIRTQIREPPLRLQQLKSVDLTHRRQLDLWRNYLDEIAVWLDMFDNDRHFQFKIPFLAKSADHLHYSILALSARQMERKCLDKSYTESLGLYQEAIQLIVKELYTLDTTVIASCVLLCVLEMMSSSPRAWCRHMNGCAMLLEVAGVNGVVGGVRQSLFWCFARMDVWGGFLEDTLTKIPTSRWFIPSGSMIEAVTHFKAGSGSHSYANYAVFLCASVVNVISNKTSSNRCQADIDSVKKTTYSARWKALFDLLEDWYNNRPEEMQPLMAYPSSSDDPREPFSVVLYGSSPAVNGNQLYHAASLLMLQDKPRGLCLSKSSKSILWHARQICGIAISNSDHGAWINCLQPLWIAGKIMSHETEHRAILDLLAQIERDTGWATAWRAEDLKDYWGD